MTLMENKQISLDTLDKFQSETIGQDILRYVTLPQFLGHEKDTLLYFIGRNLARDIHIKSIEDLVYVFQKLRWGNLELIKEKKGYLTFHLMSDDIVHRLKYPVETDFRLESGFLAETLQKITERPCECTETVSERLYRVQFKVFFTD